MSENENLDELNEETPAEELPMEDKKKAVNLQDLVYVKKYIDDNYYTKKENAEMINNKVLEELADKCYTKEQTYSKEETYSKTEIDENHYNKTEADDTFYKKNETVDDSKKINGIEITKDENGVLRSGDIVIPQEKILWSDEVSLIPSGDYEYKEISNLEFADGDVIEMEYNISGDNNTSGDNHSFCRFTYVSGRNINIWFPYGPQSNYLLRMFYRDGTLIINKLTKDQVAFTAAGTITIYGFRKIIK